MKKYGIFILLVLALCSCQKDFDRAMKSADKEMILKIANKYYEKKKWNEAIMLYERLPKLVAGTSDAPDVVYRTAYANYYLKQYRFAAHQFKSFSNAFSNDPRKEESAYMAALCYYQGSLEYELDQENTISAINELQDFLNNYPNSERLKNINSLIDELSFKIEIKAYENARKYFKMSEYKAAVIAFENVLNDYPATKLKSKINQYILTSKYELALNSVYNLKEERLQIAIAYCKNIEKENKEADLVKKASDLRTKLLIESDKFAKLKLEVEAKEKEIQAKLKRLSGSEKSEETKQQSKEELRKEKENLELQKQAIQATTPDPKATFNIKNYTK